MSIAAQQIFDNWIDYHVTFMANGAISSSVIKDIETMLTDPNSITPLDPSQIPAGLSNLANKLLDTRKKVMEAFTPTPDPRPGQIRLIKDIVLPKDSPLKEGDHNLELKFPLAVCLDEPCPLHPTVWKAWMALPNTAMVSRYDLVLEDEDMPFDPIVGFISTLLGTHVYIPSTSNVLGQLNDERLAALRELYWSVSEDLTQVDVHPGQLVKRHTLKGRPITTGTPTGPYESNDIRAQYKRIFFEFAMLIANSE